jgi:hypothetical protein
MSADVEGGVVYDALEEPDWHLRELTRWENGPGG